MPIRLRNILRFIVAFGLFTLVFALVMDKIVMPIYTRHGSEVVLLDVQQKNLDEARAILTTNKFKVEVTDSVENPNLPSGTVIDQQPPPGYRVKRGRVVRLVVTSGVRYFPMPNLVGTVLKAAQLELDRHHIVIDSLIYGFSSDKPKGVIADQSIPPGFKVSLNSSVILTVSDGPPAHQLVVPDLFGMNLEEAKKVIRRAGFRMGTIRYIPSTELTPYTVIGQYPETGTLEDNAIPIDLEVTTTEMEGK